MFSNLIVRVGSALTTLILSLAASIFLSKSDFGSFTVIFSLLLLYSVIVRFGLDKAAVRFISPVLSNSLFANQMRNRIFSVFFLLLLITLPIPYVLHKYFLMEYEFLHVLFAFEFFSLHLFLASLLRGFDQINLSIFLFGVWVQLCLICTLLINHLFFVQNILNLISFYSFIGIFLSLFYLHKASALSFSFDLSFSYLEYKDIFLLFLSNLILVGMQHFPIVILGSLATHEVVASYQYAALFSMLFGIFPLVAISVYEVKFSLNKNEDHVLRDLSIKYFSQRRYFILFISLLSILIFLFFKSLFDPIVLLLLVLSQIFNIYSIHFQIYNNVLGSPFLNFKILTFSIIVLLLFSIGLGSWFSVYGVAISIFLSYFLKYILFYNFSKFI